MGFHQMVVVPLDWWATLGFLLFSFRDRELVVSLTIMSVAMTISRGSETGSCTVIGWATGKH